MGAAEPFQNSAYSRPLLPTYRSGLYPPVVAPGDVDTAAFCTEARTPPAVVVLNQTERLTGTALVYGVERVLGGGVTKRLPSKLRSVAKMESEFQVAPPVMVAVVPVMESRAVVAPEPPVAGLPSVSC